MRSKKKAVDKNPSLFENIVMHSREVILITDNEGIITFWNPAAERIYGWSKDDARDHSLSDLMINADSRQNYKDALHHLHEKSEWTGQLSVHTKEGREFPVHMTLSPLNSTDKKNESLIVTLHDMTEEKQITEKLNYEQHFINIVLDAQLDTFFLFDPHTQKALRWNRAFREISGYTNEEIAHLSVPGSYFGKEDLKRASSFIEELYEKKTGIIELEFICKNGKKIPTEYRVSVVEDEEGKFLYCISIGRDITNRRQTEKILRQNAELYRVLLENIPDVVMRFDKYGRHLFVSPKMDKIIDVPVQDFIGKTHNEIGFPVDQSQFWEQNILRVFENALPSETEFSYMRKNEVVICNVRFIPEFDAQGDVRSVLSIVRDITDLRTVEKDYQTLFEEMLDGFALHEIICNDKGIPVDYRFLDINPAFQRMTGFKRDIIGKSFLQILPNSESYWIEIYGKVALTGEPITFENYSREIGKYFKVTAFSPKYKQFACIFIDITEQRNAEHKLREHEKVLTDILDVTLSGYWDWNVSENTAYLSPGFKKMFGFEDHELPNTPETWNALIFPEDHPEILKVFNEHVKSHGKVPFYNEVRYKHKDGSTIWVISVGRVIEWSNDGAPLRLVGCHVDITRRKNMEEELKKESHMRKVLMDNIPGSYAMVIKTGTMEIVASNKAAREIGAVPGEICFKRLMHRDMPCPVCKAPELWKSGISQHLEFEFQGKWYDGTWVYLSNDLYAHYLVDITNRKNAEKNLQNTQRLESLGILAGGIAHDFNNLLGGIYGCIEMARELSSNLLVKERLDKAVDTIDRARGLTRQLLTFAKGGAPIRDVHSFVPFIKEITNFALSGSHVTSEFHIQKDLWSADFDKSQISQVINNIVINAQQAMPNGGSIIVSARNVIFKQGEHGKLEEGKYVEISIQDNGIGIPPESLVHIFDPFYTTKAQGHGLGLAICYSIISRHGGCIDIESEQHKGSIFRFFLPAVTDSTTKNKMDISSKHDGNGIILVMDDEQAMLEALEITLTFLGYTVVTAGNGDDIMAHYKRLIKQKNVIKGIIVDLTIAGGMGGQEVVRRIRELDKEIPVLVMSGYAEDPIMAKPQEYGFTDSLSKPFRRTELVKMLNLYFV